MPRLLVVEDQKKLLRTVQQGLTEDGYDVLVAADGEDGYYLATTETIDLLVLDVMLPGRDGFQILRDLRSSGFSKPILMLTARDSIDDRVRGLDLGADDYLVKPFAFEELLARIRALLRRVPTGQTLVLRAGDLEMNLVTRRVVRNGVEIVLSPREFELLEYFLRHVNQTLTREMIARDVWTDAQTIETNVIDVYVNYLRKKVEQRGLPQLIRTVRGVGYCLRVEN